MKINLATPLLVMALSLTGASAHAQAYPLTMTGLVTSPSCGLTVDAIALGDVPLAEFVSSSLPAARYSKSFDVRLQNCEVSSLSAASLKFSGTITGSTSVLALTNMNSPGVAVGIGVQITTNDAQHGSTGTPVKFDGSESYAFRPASGKSSYTFLASYIRSPTAPSRAPGTANATATVTLTYS
jgi:type 1 fimbria pilin